MPTNFAMTVSTELTLAFVVLVLAVVAQDVCLVARAAPEGERGRWRRWALATATLWVAAHLAVARSGVMEADTMPPRLVFYLPPTLLLGVWAAFSPVGTRLAQLPLGWLVAAQAFRLPLEIWLHTLMEGGALPVQMTWSGWNFDVLTGLGALALALYGWRRPLPRAAVVAWNAMGLLLLVTVVTIAVLSTPTPLRRFHEGPPVLLPYNAPFNLIVSVHVWTAWVGHLVVTRALLRRSRTDA